MLTDTASPAISTAAIPPAPAERRAFAEVARKLDAATFDGIVACTPLVAIDLIVEDLNGAVLLGMRNNPPAKNSWFVPGGRVRKGETLAAAFCRITQDELGYQAFITQSRLLGVYEHFYDTNFMGLPGATTHYVVLAHRLRLDPALLNLPQNQPNSQHDRYLWLTPEQIARHPGVHANVRTYFLS